MNNRPDFKIGDTVRYRGGFGLDNPKEATITGMTLSEEPHDKYGEEVEECTRGQVRMDRVCFSLSDNHWCYSSQIVGV